MNKLSRRYLLVFFGTLGLLLLAVALDGAGLVGGKKWAFAGGPGMRDQAPPDSHYFLSHTVYGGHLDHAFFYYDIGSSLAHARQAEIIVFGNSRNVFGLDETLLADFTRQHGVRFFNMGFPDGDNFYFPKLLLEKYTFHSKICLINVDWFFRPDPTAFVDHDIKLGWWGSRKVALSEYLRYESHLFFQSFAPLPFLDFLGMKPDPQFHYDSAFFRSTRNGQWYAKPYLRRCQLREPPQPIPPDADIDASPGELKSALEFQALLRREGTEIVLISVPTQIFSPKKAGQIAAELHVPYLYVGGNGLFMCDHSHLDAPSARLYTTSILAQLQKSPSFTKAFPAANAH
jgi:hypothetical protein